MSWQDRDYNRGGPSSFSRGGMSIGFPKPTKYVKYLLIINIAIFVIQSITRGTLESGFALIGNEGINSLLQSWRLITYQFLHGGTFHLLFNMLGLYFFGPPIENYWGSRPFLIFYLACGVVGGFAFIGLSMLTNQPSYLIGASGAILGLLAACAVLFPNMIIILLFFPVPIRFAALLLAGIYGLQIISKGDLSDACHFGGMATGFLYTYYGSFFSKLSAKRTSKRRSQSFQQEARDRQRVDEILDKVHRNGIQSLSWRERRTLKKITNRQRKNEK